MLPYKILDNSEEFLNDVRECYPYLSELGKRLHPIGALKSITLLGGSPERVPVEHMFRKYPFLMGYVLVWELPPGEKVPAHKDGPTSVEQGNPRRVAINFPISGCNPSCVTSFYDVEEKYVYTDMQAKSRFFKPNDTTKIIAQYRLLDKPIMLDTQVFHDLDNEHNHEMRIAVSWTTRFLTLAEGIEYFSK